MPFVYDLCTISLIDAKGTFLMSVPLGQKEVTLMEINVVEGQFLTTTGLAKLLGKSPATLAWWRSRGKGPNFMKAGNTVIYSVEDVAAWLKKNKRSPRDARTNRAN